MKYFFDEVTPVAPSMMAELLKQAREELQKQQMNVAEMKTRVDLVCFNSSSMSDYVPKGMDAVIKSRVVEIGQVVPQNLAREVNLMVTKMSETPLGYVFANIQNKQIEAYFDLLFKLKRDFEYEPAVITHCSDDELLEYLAYFLSSSDLDGVERKLEIFNEKSNTPWKTVVNSQELLTVDKGARPAAILSAPFFSDIHLHMTQNHQDKVFGYAWGKLRSAFGHFNRQVKGGVVVRSKNTMYLNWKDIEGFKLASSQCKTFMGISINGEFTPSNQFLSKNVGLNLIKKEDIDFIRLRIGRGAVDVKPEEIANFEVNLDSRQIIINRGVAKDDFHITKFKRLKLIKGSESALIHKVIPFNRGESNFEMIQQYLGTRYTEYEKVRQMRSDQGSLSFIASRNVMSCDLTAQLVLSSMQLLGILPLNPRCIGFKPLDVKNPEKMKEFYNDRYEEVKELIIKILDLSETPNFTEQNFKTRTKICREFLEMAPGDVTTENLEEMIKELEGLTQYMDDFFKLDIYNKFQDDLECETSTEVDEQPAVEQALEEEEYQHLDKDTKDFVAENFSFFKKRDYAQSAILRIEQMLFYTKNVREYVENRDFEPDMIIYSKGKDVLQNYRSAGYPALSLSKMLSPEILTHEDEDEELLFVQFMRAFTKKVYVKSLELNKSFHHQYKHTLSELSFHVSEKLMELETELEFLENPDNKEEAYVRMLEKMTALFHQHLNDKNKLIEDLNTELAEVEREINENRLSLEKLLGEEVKNEELRTLLPTMPERLEVMRKELIQRHDRKKKQISSVFMPYINLRRAIVLYFEKVRAYSGQFQKALWIHQQQQMFLEVRKEITPFFQQGPEKLEMLIEKLNKWQYDKSIERSYQAEIDRHLLKINSYLDDIKKASSSPLFSRKDLEQGNLREFLDYYHLETGKLIDQVGTLQTIYLQLNNIQNALFKKQGELIGSKISYAKNELMIQIAEMIFRSPSCQEQVEELLQQKESVPKEIKEELGELRSKMNDALGKFKPVTMKQNLDKVGDYEEIFTQSDRRDKINEVAKDLVNFTQGEDALKIEIEAEIKDRDYLAAQEPHLEKIVMSKSLPSTRVLLKNKYIPMMKIEQKMLTRANQFLGEIFTKAEELKDELSTVFFKRRHHAYQLTNGAYFVNSKRGSKNYTEKNVFSAQMMIAEHYPKCCAAANSITKRVGLQKLEILGVEGIKNRISQIWQGLAKERFLFLPTYLTLKEVLELCEYKDRIVWESPRPSKSKNFVVLVYMGLIDFNEIRRNKDLLDKYHQAVLSNIFIEIDDNVIYNNKQSIFEGYINNTFGLCNDEIGDQIRQTFLFDG